MAHHHGGIEQAVGTPISSSGGLTLPTTTTVGGAPMLQQQISLHQQQQQAVAAAMAQHHMMNAAVGAGGGYSGAVPNGAQVVGLTSFHPQPGQQMHHSLGHPGAITPTGGQPPPQQQLDSGGHKTPNSNDACQSIVHCLMCYHTGKDEEFSRKAIESLIKKLKDKRDELDALITAVTTNGKTPTKCVTIQRTLDGRLQVAARKGFPHVVYAKIWRWPDLHKNELKQRESCIYAFDLKADLVCVNPYHYERVVSPGIGSLDLSSLKIEAAGSSSTIGGDMGSPSGIDLGCGPPSASSSTTGGYRHDSQQISPGGHHQQQHLLAQGVVASGGNTSSDVIPSQNINHGQPSGVPQNSSGGAYVSPGGRQISPGGQPRTGHLPQISPPAYVSPASNGAAPPPPLYSAVPSAPQGSWTPAAAQHANALAQQQQWQAVAAQQQAVARQQQQQEMLERARGQFLTDQPLPDYWCGISYYELDSQVGETYKAPSQVSSVYIDGGVDPSGVHESGASRFCLGALSNVHRSDTSEKARQYIGKGIQLVLKGEGDVEMEVLCDRSVFVQSYYLDREAGRMPGDAVHKVYPNARLKLFDLCTCYSQMREQASMAQAAAHTQAAAVAGFQTPVGATTSSANAGSLSQAANIGVDDLRRLCVLRISFVKGWGPDYPRSSIKMTPCWIEVQLSRALQLLDEVLHQMPT